MAARLHELLDPFRGHGRPRAVDLDKVPASTEVLQAGVCDSLAPGEVKCLEAEEGEEEAASKVCYCFEKSNPMTYVLVAGNLNDLKAFIHCLSHFGLLSNLPV